jgi:tRNA (mo5U34)-methyltransferase
MEPSMTNASYLASLPANPDAAEHGANRPLDVSVGDWVRSQVESEPYWFYRIELPNGVVTPGWNDPKTEKLPYFGLPDDMTGMRVLDIGHAEGFFCFEAERRGAEEIIGIENYGPMIRKFNTCRVALGSKAQSFRGSVYDLDPVTLGTFDLVLFFGVLYHLRHPLLALAKIHGVCTGMLLMQTAICADTSDKPIAEFHPFGIKSGPPEAPIHDPTCFWFPNPACCAAMLEHVGFTEIARVHPESAAGAIFRAESKTREKGRSPDETTAPWS